MKNKGTLKNILGEKGFIRIVGAHDAMTAKLVEKNGFDGVWASGLEISTSHAVPDANILTMTDFLAASAEMANSVAIPIVSDCDTGYGNSNNVIHMVKKFEAAGVSAVCIEDKRFPKVNSFIPGRQLLAPVAEFVGKIMAAKHAQSTDNFLVFARVEALIAGWGMDEAIRRAETYVEAGADGIFIHSKAKTPHEIMEFCKRWDGKAPLIICPTTYPSLKEDEMRSLGVNIVIYANQGIRASIRAVNEVLGHIGARGLDGVDRKIAPMSEVFELQGMHIMKENEEKYLGTEKGSVRAIIPAAGSKIDRSLKDMLEDRPLGMLDIDGKPLLQRNVETLNNAGVQDINVVVGYKGSSVSVEGAKLVDNDEYGTKGMMHSILRGAEEPADKNIIVYSDILFDQELIRKLLNKDDDMILVVDGTYKKTHARNKKLELVVTECQPPDGVRTLDLNRRSGILKIGKDLAEDKAHYEFIGMALFSKKGLSILKKEYAPAHHRLSFIEFMQYLIDKGYKVSSYAVAEGWMEVHTFDDYKRVSSIFRGT